ncbi:MAG TPA: pyridoxamine 5'-phosphate oxidase family protein [Streptosporangiaceae bacterium]|jgi:transcriptional regulator with XRE-family HTH domain|nr:pyridoxamine 5'-phosphate oxidase family protein [Streptosporangiaceae bacterium]
MGNRSDLGRRVARRRSELGLTVDQLADRSGMTPGYIEYLEHHAANITAEALVRLATGLETTGASLLGEGVDRPAGGGLRPDRRRRLDRLSESECRALIAPGGVGRVVFSSGRGPEALPVNYSFVKDVLVFRTAPDSPLAGVIGTDVGFEVDRLDEAFGEGWSVLVSGPASKITEPALVWQLADAVQPWAGGNRDIFIRIEPHRITGRRVRSADRS